MAFTKGNPHLNIERDQGMDLWTVKEFLSFESDDMFSNTILTLNPTLENARNLKNTKREAFYTDYISQIYKRDATYLEKIKKELQDNWNSIEQDFLKITQDLFNSHPWPEGCYVGFLSIFNCNPRFLNQKTFQCYYKHQEGLLYVSAHEMLHFMFYDYIEKNPNLVKKASEATIWDLSEILNIVILSLPEFTRLTANPNPKPYPKHVDLIPEYVKLWNSKNQIDHFIKNAIKRLS